MGGAAREGLDAHLIAVVSQYANQHQCKSFTLVGPPPRRVALAMALAILAQPHLSVTFHDLDPVGDDHAVRPPKPYSESALIIDTETLCDALALSAWELDQLREEIDRNVSYLLKQQRAFGGCGRDMRSQIRRKKAFSPFYFLGSPPQRAVCLALVDSCMGYWMANAYKGRTHCIHRSYRPKAWREFNQEAPLLVNFSILH